MNPIDYVIIGVIAAIVGLSVFSILRMKKKGNACIGCPNSAQCSASKLDSCPHHKE